MCAPALRNLIPTSGGSAFPIKNGSEFSIGPNPLFNEEPLDLEPRRGRRRDANGDAARTETGTQLVLTACPRRGRSWPCHPPWPPTAVALAVVGSSRERPGHPDRVRLRCPKSFAPSDCSGRTSWWGTSGRTLGYVLVVRPVITGTSAASCHNLPGTKAIRGAHFRLGHRAPGRGGRQARTVSGCLNSAFLGLFSTSCGPSFLAMDTQLGAAGRRTPTGVPRLGLGRENNGR